MPSASSSSSSTSSSSSSSSAVPSVKPEPPSNTPPSSTNDYSSISQMAVAPYVPPTSLFQDLDLPFLTEDSSSGLWDFGSTDGGGVPFVSGAQIEGQHDNQIAALNEAAVSSNAPSNQDFASSSRNFNDFTTTSSGGSQMPTHIAKNNPFLNKLRSMVDDSATDELICWSRDGDTFLVPNHVRFGDEVLPRFFKHNRFSSFVRQLNMYGFHKVPHLQQGALKSDLGQENELWEFQNDNFKRDRPELLLNMQRKKGVRNEEEGGKTKGKDHDAAEDGGTPLNDMSGALMRQKKMDSEGGALQLASVWSAIQSIQSAQQGINDNLRHLHNSNNELFREAAEQRNRTQKQEETINKMLRFLAGVFGAQDVGGLGGGEKRGGQGGGSKGDTSNKRRKVVVRPPFSKNQSGRLMIGDSSMIENNDDLVEELEVPMNNDDNAAIIEELSAFSRSNTNSPRGGSTSPRHRFTSTDSPEQQKNLDLPSISSEVVSTPGGGRSISQQAGAQIINALASGDGSAWLANLFGGQQQPSENLAPGHTASPSKGHDKMASTPGGNSFKLDAQTLAALQSVLGGMSNGEGVPGVNNSYFGGGSSANPRANTSASGNNTAWSSAQQPSISATAQPWAPGASSSTPQANNNGSIVTPTSDSNKIARLTRNYQNIQGTEQNTAMVQNAFNALVEGLRTESEGPAGNAMGTNASNKPPGSTNERPIPTSNNTSQRSEEENAASASADVDMDLLLKEFLNSSNTSTSSANGLTPNAHATPYSNGIGGDIDGQTPDFAFSPSPNDNAVQHHRDEASKASQSKTTSIGMAGDSTSAISTPDKDSPTTTTKKRKPINFEGALGADIELANAKAIKNARISNVSTDIIE
ncbi:hypothetical protein CBS101457_006520 [Exobasidium rhododendri]|nr:hypothetical protein CBS101457_006520 [Exobasidium rhododendri]